MSLRNQTGWAGIDSNGETSPSKGIGPQSRQRPLGSGYNETQFSCPACGSDNTQRLSIAHTSGISQLSAVTNAIGWGRGLVFLSGHTTGTSRTQLSQLIAPPLKKGYRNGLLLLLLSPLLAALAAETMLLAARYAFGAILNYEHLATATFCVIELAAMVLLVRAFRFNKKAWPKLLREWQMSFICQRCGHIFVTAVPRLAPRKL